LPEDELPAEIRRLEGALGRTREQVLEVQRKVTEAMGAKDASIFDAHLLVLEDPVLIDEVSRIVMNDQVNVEYAFQEFTERYAETLSRMNDEYLKERVSDMRDVASRVLNNLLGRENHTGLPQLTEPAIVISHDLAPSVTAQLDKHLVIGFATDVGSKTSHTAIMARSLRIPAVVGLTRASEQLESGEYALLDGYNGVVIINPTDQTLFEYGQLARRQLRIEEKLRDLRDEPAVTLDGSRVVLSANIEQADDARAVQECGAQGVGLFRTEYLFINRESLPSEEEQYRAYRQIAAALNPQPVVVRTLDLGGDKFLSHLQVPSEMNPFLGWRAIRFCLQERAIFRDQIRAILRAGAEGNVKMMYPMISGLDELRQANRLVDEIKRELAAEQLPHDAHMEIGVMVEIPSAALTADSLAQHAGFFSVGTNDLIQYTLAVDRLNEKIAHLYEPTHPAILRLIKLTVDAAHQRGIWAGVCGEMAAEPALLPLLLGLGVDELSVTPSSVPQVKFMIRRLKMNEARELADFALNCSSPAEILEHSQSLAMRIAPSLFENQTLTS
jgi:phosphotransferase system enzyme I (PtsI)